MVAKEVVFALAEEEEVDVGGVEHPRLLCVRLRPTTLDYSHNRLKKKMEKKDRRVVHKEAAHRAVVLFFHPLLPVQEGNRKRRCW